MPIHEYKCSKGHITTKTQSILDDIIPYVLCEEKDCLEIAKKIVSVPGKRIGGIIPSTKEYLNQPLNYLIVLY